MKPHFEYYTNGNLSHKIWYVNDKYHRLDGPAYQRWYDTGHLWQTVWYIDGEYHRLDGPAFQQWHEDGKLKVEEWWIEGKLHRIDGPAWQRWSHDGQLLSKYWYIGDKKVEPISDPLAWALWVAENFGNVYGLEKFCYENIEERTAMAILASSKLL